MQVHVVAGLPGYSNALLSISRAPYSMCSPPLCCPGPGSALLSYSVPPAARETSLLALGLAGATFFILGVFIA